MSKNYTLTNHCVKCFRDKLFTSLNEINSDTDELSKAETKDCNIDKLDPDQLLR